MATTATPWRPDVTGLIRALGERDATLVGSGYGGVVAWTTAALHPRSVRRLVVTAAAHPLRLQAAVVSHPRAQLSAAGPMAKFQLPRYEHVLTSATTRPWSASTCAGGRAPTGR